MSASKHAEGWLPKRRPSRRSGQRLISSLCAIIVGLGLLVLGFVTASSASAWAVQASASSTCSSGNTVVLDGTFTNNETKQSGDMNVTMEWLNKSDGPKLVAHQSTGNFSIDTGLQTLPAGSVTFQETWAHMQGSDTKTAYFNAGDCTPSPKKVYVCKYVGTPGTDERLQTGQNPIDVSVNAIKEDPVVVGSYFADAQGRSFVLAFDTGQPAPDVSQCPAPQGPPELTQVTPGEPTHTTTDCTSQTETVTPSNQEGVVWSPSGSTTLQPGQSVTYTASPAEGFAFPETAQTSWAFTNGLDTSKCTTTPPTHVQGTASGTATCNTNGTYTVNVSATGLVSQTGQNNPNGFYQGGTLVQDANQHALTPLTNTDANGDVTFAAFTYNPMGKASVHMEVDSTRASGGVAVGFDVHFDVCGPTTTPTTPAPVHTTPPPAQHTTPPVVHHSTTPPVHHTTPVTHATPVSNVTSSFVPGPGGTGDGNLPTSSRRNPVLLGLSLALIVGGLTVAPWRRRGEQG